MCQMEIDATFHWAHKNLFPNPIIHNKIIGDTLNMQKIQVSTVIITCANYFF